MNNLRARCRESLQLVEGAQLVSHAPLSFDELAGTTTDQSRMMRVEFGLPPDAAHLAYFTVPEGKYNEMVDEVDALKPSKRKNWKGKLYHKTQFRSVVWSKRLGRIHSADNSFYVVNRSLYDAVMAKHASLRIPTTRTGHAVVKEGMLMGEGSSASARSPDEVMAEEEFSLLTLNHKPHEWSVRVPPPGQRIVR